MIKVTKGNVVLRVEDKLLDYYVDRGYTAKTLEGKIIKEAIPTDVASLRKAYIHLKQENEALKKKIDDLTNEKSQPQKIEQPIVSEDKPIVSEDKPKRTRKKSFDEE